jgi:hypothetical protein
MFLTYKYRFLPFKRRVMENFWLRLAWMLPRTLVYWCAIRVGANATQGKWQRECVTDLLIIDALKRWEKSSIS